MTMHPSADLVRKAESFAAVCICTATRMIRGCPRHNPGGSGTPESHHAMLIRIIENQEKIMTEVSQAQTDVNNAVTVFTGILTDIQTQTSGLVTAAQSIATAIANGQPVDTTALNTLVSGAQAVDSALDSAVSSVSALAPAPAAPAQPGTAGSAAPVTAGDSGSAS